MLTLWKLKVQDNIEFKDNVIKSNIAKFLSSSSSDNLELAELLFTSAKDISRNSDFTKADSYDGLAQLHQFKLEHAAQIFSSDQKQELQDKIEKYTIKSEALNRQLKRKGNPNL